MERSENTYKVYFTTCLISGSIEMSHFLSSILRGGEREELYEKPALKLASGASRVMHIIYSSYLSVADSDQAIDHRLD